MIRVQACLNGARPNGFHPALPLTAAALARDAAACAAAGAAALHLHPRDAAGREALEPSVIAAAVVAVRQVTRLPISVSTGAWITGDDVGRRVALRGWAELGRNRPDEASVNLAEADAPAVMLALRSAGIGVEAGLASPADAERFLSLGVECRRVLVEIPDFPGAEALALADAILDRLDAAGQGAERQLHGEGRSVWPCFDRAAALGLSARLGLEDGAGLPNGSTADGNAALVRAGLRRAARRPA